MCDLVQFREYGYATSSSHHNTKEEQRSMVLALWAEGLQGAEIHVYVLSMATTLFLGEVYTSG
jgi:hypothetical protein